MPLLRGSSYKSSLSQELGLPDDYMPPPAEGEGEDYFLESTAGSSSAPAPTPTPTLRADGEIDKPPPPSRKRVSASNASGGGRRKRYGNASTGSARGSLLDDALIRVMADKRGKGAGRDPPSSSSPSPRAPLPPLEYCLVCRLESGAAHGTLVVCDFPACRRAYHPACIPARLPPPFPPAEDVWFCPAHFCTGCSSLEACKQKIDAFPLEVLSTGAYMSGGVDLCHCSTCPFSVCLSCAAGLGGGRGRGGAVSAGGFGLFRNVHVNTLLANEVRLPQAAAAMSLALKDSSKKVRYLHSLAHHTRNDVFSTIPSARKYVRGE